MLCGEGERAALTESAGPRNVVNISSRPYAVTIAVLICVHAQTARRVCRQVQPGCPGSEAVHAKAYCSENCCAGVEYLYTEPHAVTAANATLAHPDIILCNKDNHSMGRSRKIDPTVITQVAAVGRATRSHGRTARNAGPASSRPMILS